MIGIFHYCRVAETNDVLNGRNFASLEPKKSFR